METTEKQAINALRILANDAIERANSGHPGVALGAAPTIYTLFRKHLFHSPKNLSMLGRDRFILSCGHASSLLYSAFHLFGYGLTAADLQNFRQIRSKTPGHPEYSITPGVETSTGPLGQGLANGVGFALAEKMLAAKYNKSGIDLVDNYTFVLCGDGDIQEGIASEAASLAGTWGLGKLIVLYDSNDITIEGPTSTNFTESVLDKFAAMGWHTLRVENGEDIEEISAAITLAKKQTEKPTLIEVKTVIGFGSTKSGSCDCHGAPLGVAVTEQLKKELNWTAKPFEVPSDVLSHYKEIIENLNKNETEYNKRANAYKKKYPTEYDEFIARQKGKVVDLVDNKDFFKFPDKPMATRAASEIVLNKLASLHSGVVGGSADLGPSNKTILKDKGFFSDQNPTGRNIQFGIREHAMASICNGLALYGGFLPYCATFLVFSDYLKPAVRMSALMGLNVIYIFSHDSIGVGEDGPTHQPIEQILQFRSVPTVKVFRPCDGIETSCAYLVAATEKGPSIIITSRQDLPVVKGTSKEALNGGYIVANSKKETPDVILIATGSEVNLAISAKEKLSDINIDARVVSMPCIEVFDSKPQKYRDSVIDPNCRARVAVEAGSSLSWHRFIGLDGAAVTIDSFGQSAPADTLFAIYGFTVEKVAEVAKKVYRNCNNAK